MNTQHAYDYFLPAETARLLTRDRLKQCKNLALLLDKYPPQIAIQDSKEKGDWLRSIASSTYIDTRLTENVYQRWRDTTTNRGAQHFSATTDWRIVVGLGGETVLETDLALHNLYGLPFIPGSALKGLTRAYVTTEIEPYKREKSMTTTKIFSVSLAHSSEREPLSFLMPYRAMAKQSLSLIS